MVGLEFEFRQFLVQMPAAFVEFPAELFGFGSLLRGGCFSRLSALKRMVELLLAVGEGRLARVNNTLAGEELLLAGLEVLASRLGLFEFGPESLDFAMQRLSVFGKHLLGGRQLVAARAQLVLLGAELLPLLFELLRGLPQFDGCALGLLRLDDQRGSFFVEPRLQDPQLPFPVGDLLGTIREFFRVCREQLALARQTLALFFERVFLAFEVGGDVRALGRLLTEQLTLFFEVSLFALQPLDLGEELFTFGRDAGPLLFDRLFATLEVRLGRLALGRLLSERFAFVLELGLFALQPLDFRQKVRALFGETGPFSFELGLTLFEILLTLLEPRGCLGRRLCGLGVVNSSGAVEVERGRLTSEVGAQCFEFALTRLQRLAFGFERLSIFFE